MKEIQQKYLQTAIKQLSILPVQFAIIDDMGNQYGDLEVAVEKVRKRKKSVYPKGSITTYVLPFIMDLAVGEVAVVPFGDWDKKSLNSGLTACASRIWGNGSYTSCTSKDHIELMRTGGHDPEEKYAAPKK
jgi:hypothetical protein